MLCQTRLNDKPIAYKLKRTKRRSIGLRIDHNGLVISAPAATPLADIEAVLQDKAGWITNKLTLWQRKKTLALTWCNDATYPLLGEPWKLSIQSSGTIQMMPLALAERNQSTPELSAIQIKKLVMAWYQQQAIVCFRQRIDFYAQKLAIPPPQFRLSNAKTRWGSCNSRGVIHLNWQLIQVPLNLVDYVVAHELSHLLEMNHSAAFWQHVKHIYPNYRVAQEALKRYTIHSK